jgi:MFS family permease
MLTMPIGGKLTDKMGPGKLVLVGIFVIALGLGVYTQVGADTPFPLLLGGLFVMGMGMGVTMMPIMSAALASLVDHQIARGSTMMNIIQQAAGSIGTAVMSVILTNQVLESQAASTFLGVQQKAIPAEAVPPAVLAEGQSALASAFGSTYMIALVLIVLCIIPALFLPRKKIERTAEQGEQPVLTGVH